MMIEWSDSYSVHNAHIDAQHKKLFELAKQAYIMLNHQVTPGEIREILAEFCNYIKEHFSDEEQYMEKIGYPEIANHKKIHNELTKSLVMLIKNVKNVNDMKEKLHIIAKKWLLDHILKEDMKIEKFRRSMLTGQNSETTEEGIEVAAEVYYYGCSCSGKLHDVPLDIHRRIQKGEKFRCKACKQDIKCVKVQKIL
ncbi:bacteriohemerythrin [Helicobacter turcicus]|uniref:Hemerythrin family protein n=1 Tax=Helicobacter turcicus TaxID=2867412 RepID=A0ABS7JLG6_9HELI|nr:hemerythrin family protein [Helicobacter turcicus]MBX7490211.1 hemerythrin family protein [Helicobacter turcicus]MBX7545210.1 hemerythrin family protein [Helicobacter turcicus]